MHFQFPLAQKSDLVDVAIQKSGFHYKKVQQSIVASGKNKHFYRLDDGSWKDCRFLLLTKEGFVKINNCSQLD